jgi:hypothetical protein
MDSKTYFSRPDLLLHCVSECLRFDQNLRDIYIYPETQGIPVQLDWDGSLFAFTANGALFKAWMDAEQKGGA